MVIDYRFQPGLPITELEPSLIFNTRTKIKTENILLKKKTEPKIEFPLSFMCETGTRAGFI